MFFLEGLDNMIDMFYMMAYPIQCLFPSKGAKLP